MKMLEITGPPCAGKSSKAKELWRESHITICNKSWLLLSLRIHWIGSTFQSFVLESALFLIGAWCLGPRRILALLYAIIKSGWKIHRQLNVFRNTLHKFSFHFLAARNKSSKTLLVDEGISHLPYLFATSKTQCPSSVRKYYPYGKPSVLVVTADFSHIVSRLSLRGHKMLNLDRNTHSFAAANQRAFEVQRKDIRKFPKEKILNGNQTAHEILDELDKS